MINNPNNKIVNDYITFIHDFYHSCYFEFDLILLEKEDIPYMFENCVFTKQHRGMCVPDNPNKIYIKEELTTNPLDFLFCFAHEYEHNIQFNQGRLIKTIDGYEWEGVFYSMLVDRNILPWEIDAKKSSFSRIDNFLNLRNI